MKVVVVRMPGGTRGGEEGSGGAVNYQETSQLRGEVGVIRTLGVANFVESGPYRMMGGVMVQWAWSDPGGRPKAEPGSKPIHFNPTQIIANTYIAPCQVLLQAQRCDQFNPRNHPGREILLLSLF